LDLPKYREKLGFVRFYTLLLLILGVIFYAGYEFANMHKTNLQAQNRLLNKSLGNLTSENEKLQSQYNVLKVELDIAQLTTERDQQSNKESINREQALKEQILFYQRVMAPEMTQDGFLMQRMEVTPTVSQRNYSIKMILLQHENIKAVIKGKLAMQVFGSADGKPANFAIEVLQDKPKTSLDFAFKYFQVIETSVTLPEGFTPDRFEINTDIYKYKRKRGNYSTTIKWQEAFTEAE
jgi:hypothetical protein